MWYRFITIASLALGLVACGNGSFRPLTVIAQPQVTVTEVKVTHISPFEQHYALELRLRNPNSFPLPIAGMDYLLFLNSRPFAHGISDQRVRLAAFGETRVTAAVISSSGQTLEQLQRLTAMDATELTYALRGGVHLAGRDLALPFFATGTIRAGHEAAQRPAFP